MSTSAANSDHPPDSHISAPASLTYWSSIAPSVSGMLGGFPQVSARDLKGSYNFLQELSDAATTATSSQEPVARLRQRKGRGEKRRRFKRAADCGAGIGRITNGLLTRVAETVDVVEPVEKFAEVVRQSSSSSPSNKRKREGDGDQERGKVGEMFVCGLQDWTPQRLKTTEGDAEGDGEEDGKRNDQRDGGVEGNGYDLIWNQWCLGHLTDSQLISYLRRCSDALAPNGWIVIKENLSTSPTGQDMYDGVDSSVTRSSAKYEEIFEKTGLRVIRKERQTGFPRGLGLLPVEMFALRPREWGC